MSAASYFVKNYNIRQVVDLMCYGTLFPHTLTSTQKITRMYRAWIRRRKQQTFHQNRGDTSQFHQQVRIARQDFTKLFNVSQKTALFGQTLTNYQQQMRDTIDPTQLFNPCRPYSATSGKYYIFGNQQLSYDPYGYYSGKRIIGHRDPGIGHVYYPDYPMDANVWQINPPFEFDDTPDEEGFKKE